mgnify:CR=1 FL=1
MTLAEKRSVRATVDNEGLSYAVTSYSDFKEVEDEEFHRLRKELVDAIKKFEKYIGITNG